jgi:hypothetical protein
VELLVIGMLVAPREEFVDEPRGVAIHRHSLLEVVED